MPGVSDLHQREVTRDHGPIRALVSFALNRNLSANMQGEPIQVDRLVSYSLVFIYLRYNQGRLLVFPHYGIFSSHKRFKLTCI